MRKNLAPLQNMPRSALASHLKKIADPKQLQFHYSLAALMPNVALAWLVAYWKNRIGRKHSFQTWKHSNGIFRMSNNAKVSVAGDWGAGTDEAYLVGKQISVGVPDYTIHLGDVYYVGDAGDNEENFLGTGRWVSRHVCGQKERKANWCCLAITMAMPDSFHFSKMYCH